MRSVALGDWLNRCYKAYEAWWFFVPASDRSTAADDGITDRVALDSQSQGATIPHFTTKDNISKSAENRRKTEQFPDCLGNPLSSLGRI
jgi:hypothetical protein